jgi:hypothetical protein
VIHHCHPFQLGSDRYNIPEDQRGSFEIERDCRLQSSDEIIHQGSSWKVVFVQFDTEDDRLTAHVRVQYNGAAHKLTPVIEAPFRKTR